jgi:hypothetical protein
VRFEIASSDADDSDLRVVTVIGKQVILHVLRAVYSLKLSGIDKAASQHNNPQDLNQCRITQPVFLPAHLTRVQSVADLTSPLRVR